MKVISNKYDIKTLINDRYKFREMYNRERKEYVERLELEELLKMSKDEARTYLIFNGDGLRGCGGQWLFWKMSETRLWFHSAGGGCLISIDLAAD